MSLRVDCRVLQVPSLTPASSKVRASQSSVNFLGVYCPKVYFGTASKHFHNPVQIRILVESFSKSVHQYCSSSLK